eukprot:TRINITY_DN13065_c0_g1_i1.p1 TRINITY_DN13065_c0_g1~~TRINITY_DN13065_c0_g1_i1.p1  ORF type:complete len:406 (-),score=48.92 TRINITY_DN13065_c0_g1_i1:106-1323(-)
MATDTGNAAVASAMPRIVLPGTELEVSRVCLGTMQLAGSVEAGSIDVTWGAVSQETATATILAALRGGINFLDCAEAYGKDRQAEKAVGRALREVYATGEFSRKDVVIATKFGKHAPLWELEDQENQSDLCPGKGQVMHDGAAVTKAIEESLACLDTDYIDLLQIHWPGNAGIVGDGDACRTFGTWEGAVSAIEALEHAKKAGKIRFWGVCNFGMKDMACLEEILKGQQACVTNQLPYNCLWRAIEHEVVGRCAQDNVGILCYSPLQQGMLSGKTCNPEEIPEGRRRTKFFGPKTQSSTFARHGAPGVEDLIFGEGKILEALKALLKPNETLADLATAWLLAQKGVSCVLVGASNPDQVMRNARVRDFDAATLDKVSEITQPLKDEFFRQGNSIDQYAKGRGRIH